MKALVQEMRQSSGDVKITVAPYHSSIAAQRYTVNVSTWFRRAGNALRATFRWRNSNLPSLVQHNASNITTAANTTNSGVPMQQLNTVHLMCCVYRTRDDPTLLQIDIRDIATDQALFQLLKTRILQRHSRLYRTVSCRSIVGIHFTKVSVLTMIKHIKYRLT